MYFLEQENAKERLRKLKAVTAEETKEGHNENEVMDVNSSDNSDQDETFELVNVSKVQKTGKKAKKEKKKRSTKEKKNEGKKLKRDALEIIEEERVEAKEGIKRKKKIVTSKRNTEEVSDPKKEKGSGEGQKGDGVKTGKKKRLQKESTKSGAKKETKKNKRKNSEESGIKEFSKKNKKAKMLNSRIEEVNIQKETGQDITFGNDGEQLLLIEGDAIQDHETFQTQDTEITDSKITVADDKCTLNPKNVFQIEDLGKENDWLKYGDSDDGVDVHRMTIQEAFANDDVIEEFVKEKADTAEAGKPKVLDLSLPGWGDWGGPGIDETKRKRKFKVPSKQVRPRKDMKLAHVIINEDRDKKFAKNQVIT